MPSRKAAGRTRVRVKRAVRAVPTSAPAPAPAPAPLRVANISEVQPAFAPPGVTSLERLVDTATQVYRQVQTTVNQLGAGAVGEWELRDVHHVDKVQRLVTLSRKLNTVLLHQLDKQPTASGDAKARVQAMMAFTLSIERRLQVPPPDPPFSAQPEPKRPHSVRRPPCRQFGQIASQDQGGRRRSRLKSGRCSTNKSPGPIAQPSPASCSSSWTRAQTSSCKSNLQ